MNYKSPLFKIILLCLLASCSVLKNQQTDDLLIGQWKSIGYGSMMDISKKSITLYDVYQTGCNENTKLPRSDFEQNYELLKVSTDSLTIQLGYTEYDFIKINEVDTPCSPSNLLGKKQNALVNFDALWHTFHENYSSFVTREVDWLAFKQKYHNQLNEKSSPLELYTLLHQMLSDMKDGHVSIDIPESLENTIEEEKDFDYLRDSFLTTFNKKYISDIKTYNKGIINWGVLKEDIGYLQVNDFEDLANYHIDAHLSIKEFGKRYWKKAEKSVNYNKDILRSVKVLFDSIFEELKLKKYLVIDIRFNGGGYDEVGLALLSHLIQKKKKAFTKKARLGNGFTRSQSIFVDPVTNPYLGEVFILTSPQTASAAETFLLAAMDLPTIKRIGSNTEGILSDVLSKRLPNGWEYGLSNEVYENFAGVNYERVGIPPDYDIAYPKQTETFYLQLLEGLQEDDVAIRQVFELINKNKSEKD